MTQNRDIVHINRGMPASDGAGVRLTRMLGTPHLMEHDPFLMLDRFQSDRASDYMAGFPDHPHRGFETITIMIDGRMRHGDNKGNTGVIGPGGIQYMTAGKGIVHSEMPEQQDGTMFGFQLWVNLPSSHKMTDARWQDFTADAIPVEQPGNDVRVRVLSGTSGRGVTGPATGAAETPLLLDIHIPAGQQHEESLPEGHNAFVAVWDGAVTVVGKEDVTVSDPDIGILGAGGQVTFRASDQDARFLLLAGRPIGEPVSRYGPFVMNSRDEIIQAAEDYRMGRF